MSYQRELLRRVTINPEVMTGKPTIRRMRIAIEQILRALAGGVSMDTLLEDYTELEKVDLQAAPLYASEIVGEEKVFTVQAG